MNYLVLDSGTSSTKAFLFNRNGKIIYSNKIKHQLNRPRKFYVECDANIILTACKNLFYDMLNFSGNTPIINAGLAVQRSTFLFWEKKSCKPISPALSWQDSRAQSIINIFSQHADTLWYKTGTPLSAHFGGPKFFHMADHNKELKDAINSNEVYFGPLSAFLSQAITGTPGVDESIACRSLLYNIHKRTWSKFALNLFGVNKKCLPPITPVYYQYGNFFDTDITLNIVIGDQQSALIGQGGLIPNTIAGNLGTSGSLQFNAGNNPIIIPGLISSLLYSNNKSKYYMVEGTINACNSIFYHLETKLNIPHNKMLWDQRVSQVKTSGIFIPGFSGLAAPYWVSGFNDVYIDLENTSKDEIIRAGMESIAFLINDIYRCLILAINQKPKIIYFSGGAARHPLLQFISDIIDIPIGYSSMKDRTAYGVYILLNPKHKFNKLKNANYIFEPNSGKFTHQKKQKWADAISSLLG